MRRRDWLHFKARKAQRCILADSVGLGKTLAALGVIKYYESRNKNVLVLVPKRLKDNWNTFKGNSTDSIYKNYLLQLSESFAAVGGDAAKHAEATKLKRQIDVLSTKIKRETQINKKQELARERYELELKLKELVA